MLGVLGLGLFVVMLDTTILNVALRTIGNPIRGLLVVGLLIFAVASNAFVHAMHVSSVVAGTLAFTSALVVICWVVRPAWTAAVPVVTCGDPVVGRQ